MSFEWDKYYREKKGLNSEPDDLIVKNLDQWDTGKAVDLGAGEGTEAIWLAQKGWQVTAVDTSKEGLKKLLSRSKSLGLQINATCADILKFVSQSSFDLVLLRFIHFTSEDRPGLFNKCRDLLKWRGRLVFISIINPDHPEKRSLPEDLIPSRAELVKQVQKAGFKVIKTEVIIREVQWSEDESFQGDNLILIAERK